MRTGKIRAKFSKSLDFSEQHRDALRKFLPYCSRSLGLTNDYTGYLVDDRENYGIDSTAYSNYASKSFYIYCKGRAFADILRSIAHELSHFSQHENDEIEGERLHFSSEYEDEANAFAGQMLNAFSEVLGYEKIFERKK
jgi:hypothetical protein